MLEDSQCKDSKRGDVLLYTDILVRQSEHVPMSIGLYGFHVYSPNLSLTLPHLAHSPRNDATTSVPLRIKLDKK